MKTGLVLGAGGTVGMAYHAGVLRALEEVGRFRPDDADLVVGTSAGSMIGAAIRTGRSTEELWQAALGEHPELSVGDPDESPWAGAFTTPWEALRRTFGAAYALQRSVVRVPIPPVPPALGRLFPGGFYTIADADERLGEWLPTEWPSKPLYLVSMDLRTGRRRVIGRTVPPTANLHQAVLASCAIPAFFQPVRIGRRVLVDGGVHSTTNLDLAGRIRCDLIIGVVPMGYDPSQPPDPARRLIRALTQRQVRRETAYARERGADVLLIRPRRADLEAFGPNMMRPRHNEVVAQVAYEQAAEVLSSSRSRDLLAGVAAA